MEKLISLLLAGDRIAAARYHMENPDIITLKTGLEVEVIYFSPYGLVQIRPWGHTIELWTAKGFIEKK